MSSGTVGRAISFDKSGAVELPAGHQPITIDSFLTKTVTMIGIILATGVGGFALAVKYPGIAALLAIGAMLAALVVVLVNSFSASRRGSPVLVSLYAVLEGLALGAFSALATNNDLSMIGLAITGVSLVVIAGIVLYTSKVIRVTSRFRKVTMTAMLAILGLYVVNLLASFIIPGGLGLWSGGAFNIILSVVIIIVAAASFIVDLDDVNRAIDAGVPDGRPTWNLVLSMLTTLVWLYVEILRLLVNTSRN